MFYIVHSGDYLFVFHLCILLVSGDIYEVYIGHISDTYIGNIWSYIHVSYVLWCLSGSVMCGVGMKTGGDSAVVGTASAKFSFKILVRESCL